MSVEAAIHQDWDGYAPLTQLVPSDRLYTGLPPISDENGVNLGFNYVALLVKSAGDVWRTSEGITGFTEQLTFFVVATSYDEAREIDKAIFDRYNKYPADGNVTFGDTTIMDMRPANRIENENEEDGVWEIMREFAVKAYVTAGVM